jgi:ribonuclease P/MRP protein subunit POP5
MAYTWRIEGAMLNGAVKYLSNSTSTYIIRVYREHYRLVWAALTFMDRVPVKGGKACIFRTIRVSGTIRKIEEEVIRRSKALILEATEQMAGEGSSALNKLLQDERAHAVDESEEEEIEGEG